MMRSDFVFRLAVVASVAIVSDGAAAGNAARLKGYLGERLDGMIERHVVAADIDYLTAPFLEKTERRGWWQTEFWGKYMHSAVPYLAYSGSERLRASVERGIDRILASQEPNGYIGNYPDDLRCGEGWDVWGIKYTMMGLLHYVDGGGAKADRALDACRRLCDYVIGEIGPGGKRGKALWQTGNWSGYASSSILEPVMWLYQRTKDRRYLDFAEYVVKGMAEPEAGPRLVDLTRKGVPVADRDGYGRTGERKPGDWSYVCKYGRSKAYEMMSCYQGLAEYCARQDGVFDDGLFGVVSRAGELIARDEVNLAGGCTCSEAWFHGAKKQHLPHFRLQETCVTTTWMRFCEKLLADSMDPKWADELEKSFYNAYLAALSADGSAFAAYTPLTGGRYYGHHHCFMHENCCSANGPRGFLCFLRNICINDGKTATFNFYASALVEGFDMYTLYPRTDYVRIVSHTEGPLTLRLRIPAWSERTSVRVNGEPQKDVRPGTYFTCPRTWKLGDIIEIGFDMPVVAHVLDHHVAFTRGPVLLARDSRFADGDLAEPFRSGSVRDGQRMDGFASVRTPSDDFWMAFAGVVPVGAHGENPEGANPVSVRFCDFASAGNSWRQGDFYRTWFPIEYGPEE